MGRDTKGFVVFLLAHPVPLPPSSVEDLGRPRLKSLVVAQLWSHMLKTPGSVPSTEQENVSNSVDFQRCV